MVWDKGFLGASIDAYRNDHGTVVEEVGKNRMRRDKLALAGEVRDIAGFITTVRGQIEGSDYKHTELNGDGSAGTTFTNKGTDGRLEAVHRRFRLGDGRLEGVLGLQSESSRFAALGSEANVPLTHTRQTAAFVLEQWTFDSGRQLSAGVRAERVRIGSEGDADPSTPQFGPAQSRSFSPRSASLGATARGV